MVETSKRRESPAAEQLTCGGLMPLGGGSVGAALLSEVAWTEIARSLKLSGRELQITWGVFDNLTEGAIAADLGVSEHTIHQHFNRLYKKLRVTTRAQVVLRVVHELLLLTRSEGSDLPPICRSRAQGRCPLQA